MTANLFGVFFSFHAFLSIPERGTLKSYFDSVSSKCKTKLRKPRGNFVCTALPGGRRSSHATPRGQQRSKLAATCSCELLSLLLALAVWQPGTTPAESLFSRTKYLSPLLRNRLPLPAYTALRWFALLVETCKESGTKPVWRSCTPSRLQGEAASTDHTIGLGYGGHAGTGKRN